MHSEVINYRHFYLLIYLRHKYCLEQRTRGGGSLNLVEFVARELEIEVGSITGAWDTAHKMELIWARVIRADTRFNNVLIFYQQVMDEHRLGKVGSYIFLIIYVNLTTFFID